MWRDAANKPSLSYAWHSVSTCWCTRGLGDRCLDLNVWNYLSLGPIKSRSMPDLIKSQLFSQDYHCTSNIYSSLIITVSLSIQMWLSSFICEYSSINDLVCIHNSSKGKFIEGKIKPMLMFLTKQNKLKTYWNSELRVSQATFERRKHGLIWQLINRIVCFGPRCRCISLDDDSIWNCWLDAAHSQFNQSCFLGPSPRLVFSLKSQTEQWKEILSSLYCKAWMYWVLQQECTCNFRQKRLSFTFSFTWFIVC